VRITRANRAVGDEWKDRAACAGMKPDVFMVPDSYLKGRKASRIEPDMAKARAVCATCPVGRECEADGTDDMWSIRNSKTPRERGASATKPGQSEIRHGSESGATAHRRRGEPACDACLAGEAAAWRVRAARRRSA